MGASPADVVYLASTIVGVMVLIVRCSVATKHPKGCTMAVSHADATRSNAPLAASDSAGGDGSPLNAAAEEQAAVGVKVAVAMADTAYLLNEQVHGFGGSVGGAVGAVVGDDLA